MSRTSDEPGSRQTRTTPRRQAAQGVVGRTPTSPSIPVQARAKVESTTETSLQTKQSVANGLLEEPETTLAEYSSTVAKDVIVTPTKRGRKRKAQPEVKEEATETPSEPKSGRSIPTKKQRPSYDKDDSADLSSEELSIKTPRKRKTAEEKAAEAMPLAARATGLRMFIGAHVSMAKGVENSVTNCVHIGGNAFALFLKSQRKWENPALQPASRDLFLKACKDHSYDSQSHVLPHGSYLVNLAQSEPDKASQSYDAFIDDLNRCESLGIKYYNFHPGAAGTTPKPEAIARLAAQLNRALAASSTVVPLLENMAGSVSGSIIGSTFEDLRDVISLIHPTHKSRIGVCLDTCHTFAAGYDLRTPPSFSATMKAFDSTVGMSYLKSWHLNDSKAPLGSRRDLHQNVGLGFLGLRAFHTLVNDSRFENMPLILETPCEKPDPKDPSGKKTVEDKSIWAREIKLLESLIGMDPEGGEFKRLEKELGEKGKSERAKVQKSHDEKLAKERKKMEKGQKSIASMFGGGGGGEGTKKEKAATSASYSEEG